MHAWALEQKETLGATSDSCSQKNTQSTEFTCPGGFSQLHVMTGHPLYGPQNQYSVYLEVLCNRSYWGQRPCQDYALCHFVATSPANLKGNFPL